MVLVADDDVAVCDLICSALMEVGLRTVTAADGEEAVALALRLQPALIILDVRMPKMDGYTALTQLRANLVTAETLVIVMTGETDPAFQARSAKLRAVAHLTKPFDVDELAETVREILARHPR